MFIPVSGATLHVAVSGPASAPVLLLLHSLGTDCSLWDAQAEAFSGRFRVIRPDMRGHGLSEATPGPYSIDGLAHDVMGVLDALGCGRIHVGGVSIGGMIAQSLASHWPERVDRLMLVDTAMAILPAASWHERAALVRRDGTAALVDTVLARWVTPSGRDLAAARGLRAMMARTPAEGYAACAEAIAAADLRTATSRLRAPTLVIVGEADESTPVSSSEALRDAIEGATLVVIPATAHLPMAEKPDAMSAAMRDFLLPPADPGDAYEAGLRVRRAVLGNAHVDRSLAAATDFDRDFQRYITAAAWGGVWTRPGLDRRTRSLLTCAMLAALGREEELALHLRATRNTGASEAEVAEAFMQVAVYAGVPAANAAVRIAKTVFATTTD